MTLRTENKIRVGIVTHYWLPHQGGVEVMAHHHALGLAERGYDVMAVASGVEGSSDYISRFYAVENGGWGDPGYRVLRRPAIDTLAERVNVPWPIPRPNLAKQIRGLARWADVVIIHGATYANSVLAVRAAKADRTPSLLIQSNPHVDYPEPLDTVERVVDRTLGRWAVRNATRVAAISEHTAAHVRRFSGRDDVDVVMPGVNLDRFRVPTADEKAAAKARLGIDEPLAITVRRLVPRQGIEDAMAAWYTAPLTDYYATLAVIGDGPQRRDLNVYAASQHVRMEGFVDDDTLTDWFAAADVFILPTRSGEGFGLAAAEAMASGLPVVCTTGGAQEEVVSLDCGTLVPPKDPRSIATAVRAYFDAPDIARAHGLAGRARVEERFTWQRCLDDLEPHVAALAPTITEYLGQPAPDPSEVLGRRLAS